MFDLAWSEIALIAVVAVVVIGPKDLPDAIRSVAKGVQKLRRMASEFQSHADELVREAKLEDVRDQIRDIRSFDIKSTIERNLDQDGEIRRTFNDDPLKDAWKPTPAADAPTSTTTGTTPAAAGEGASPAGGQIHGPESPAAAPEPTRPAGPPAFVPPSLAAETGRDTNPGPARPAESSPAMSHTPNASPAPGPSAPGPSAPGSSAPGPTVSDTGAAKPTSSV